MLQGSEKYDALSSDLSLALVQGSQKGVRHLLHKNLKQFSMVEETAQLAASAGVLQLA
jgi:hypothetical protein